MRCLACAAVDFDGSRVNESCPGEVLCVACKQPLDEYRYCSVCGKTAPIVEGDAA
jgi:hypothetical protein